MEDQIRQRYTRQGQVVKSVNKDESGYIVVVETEIGDRTILLDENGEMFGAQG